jgi:hypothetical protein
VKMLLMLNWWIGSRVMRPAPHRLYQQASDYYVGGAPQFHHSMTWPKQTSRLRADMRGWMTNLRSNYFGPAGVGAELPVVAGCSPTPRLSSRRSSRPSWRSSRRLFAVFTPLFPAFHPRGLSLIHLKLI